MAQWVKYPPANAGDWVRKIPWRRPWQPTPVFLPGESYGRRSLAGYSPWGRKEAETTERLNNNNTRGWCCFSGEVGIQWLRPDSRPETGGTPWIGWHRSRLVAQSWGNAGRWFQTRGRLALFPIEGATQGQHKASNAGKVASLVAQNLPAVWETWVWSLDLEDPLEKGVGRDCLPECWRQPPPFKGFWKDDL